ncbi:MAG: phosphonate ABC transporter ATP-binding protein [Leptospirales bacterium]
MEPVLKLQNVSIRISPNSAPILIGLNLSVAAGEKVALLGRSGAGKTTLLRALNGTVPISEGEIYVEGGPISRLRGRDLRSLRLRIGFVSQKHDLVESLAVHQNVMAGALGRWSTWHALRYLLWPRPDELEEAESALRKVGLSEKLRSPTTSLSGGQQQRVAIARALVQGPKILVADEPVASLDPVTARAVLELLCGIADRSGVALICSLHQPELANHYFERQIEIREGSAIEFPSNPTFFQPHPLLRH